MIVRVWPAGRAFFRTLLAIHEFRVHCSHCIEFQCSQFMLHGYKRTRRSNCWYFFRKQAMEKCSYDLHEAPGDIEGLQYILDYLDRLEAQAQEQMGIPPCTPAIELNLEQFHIDCAPCQDQAPLKMIKHEIKEEQIEFPDPPTNGNGCHAPQKLMWIMHEHDPCVISQQFYAKHLRKPRDAGIRKEHPSQVLQIIVSNSRSHSARFYAGTSSGWEN